MPYHVLSVLLLDGSGGEGVKVEAAGGNGFQRCCQLPALQGVYR